jgi:hypothetical protein
MLLHMWTRAAVEGSNVFVQFDVCDVQDKVKIFCEFLVVIL